MYIFIVSECLLPGGDAFGGSVDSNGAGSDFNGSLNSTGGGSGPHCAVANADGGGDFDRLPLISDFLTPMRKLFKISTDLPEIHMKFIMFMMILIFI